MANGTTKLLTPKIVTKLRYTLPKSWTKAAGLMRHKRKAMERHLKTVRAEWDRRAS